MNTTQPTHEQCQAAVTSYLESQKNITPDTSKKVQSGSAITVDYIGRLANGEVFDTSIESVAKECGLYNEARGYGSGLDFVAGSVHPQSGEAQCRRFRRRPAGPAAGPGNGGSRY